MSEPTGFEKRVALLRGTGFGPHAARQILQESDEPLWEFVDQVRNLDPAHWMKQTNVTGSLMHSLSELLAPRHKP